MKLAKRMLVLAATLTACVPPALTPPQPVALHTSATPTAVVQAASRELAAAGYDIATSDASAGILSATRKAAPEAFGADLVCRGAKGSMLERLAETTFRVTVTARPTATGSDVQIATKTLTSMAKMPGMFANSADSETDCVSAGAVEKRVAAALAP